MQVVFQYMWIDGSEETIQKQKLVSVRGARVVLLHTPFCFSLFSSVSLSLSFSLIHLSN